MKHRTDFVSKTHRGDTVLEHDGMPEWTIRLWWDPHEDGSVYWVDFEIVEMVGRATDDTLLYQKADSPSSPNPVESIDDGEVQVSGFVKWDGCTQFDVGSVHIDHVNQLARLLSAIETARAMASEAMFAGAMIKEEYDPKPKPPISSLRDRLVVTGVDTAEGIITTSFKL